MTKKEKAEFDAAIRRAETIAALRWTWPVEKDLPIPEWGKQTSGFDFNLYSMEVVERWSEYSAHGLGPKRLGVASQNGRQLFSTRALALKALRHAVEKEAAENLLKIDKMITDELSNKNNQ